LRQELGYFSTDKPYPRGELAVKSPMVTPGYYQRPEVTANMLDEDGYYKTGDIVAELERDHLVFVDRRNNVLKLAQGEFVAISRLEAIFARSTVLQQIYLYGNSERAYLLAVVVPDRDALGHRMCDESVIKSTVLASIHAIAAEAQLNSYEIPRDLLLETEPWTQQSGLLTGVGKLARPALSARYGDRLEQLYRDIENRQTTELQAVRAGATGRPVVDTVRRAVAATLGTSSDECGPELRFSELGGDSLSALSLSELLKETFGVQVPVGVIIDPSGDLSCIARHIEAHRDADTGRPAVRSVHPDADTVVRANELTLDKFIDAETLSLASTLTPPVDDVRTVLLTGANGFLGRFLCLEWLERLAAEGGSLICVARGADAADARRRMENSFDTGDPNLSERFRALAAGRLRSSPVTSGKPMWDSTRKRGTDWHATST